MATYYITETADVDWATVNWDNLTPYKFRHESSEGHLVAQEEYERRRTNGEPAVLWRFDDSDNSPTLLERCNV